MDISRLEEYVISSGGRNSSMWDILIWNLGLIPTLSTYIKIHSRLYVDSLYNYKLFFKLTIKGPIGPNVNPILQITGL